MGGEVLSVNGEGKPKGYEIHNAVIDAAVTVNLDADGYFPLKEFLKVVERIARDDYSE
jgi:hypothetical protein